MASARLGRAFTKAALKSIALISVCALSLTAQEQAKPQPQSDTQTLQDLQTQLHQLQEQMSALQARMGELSAQPPAAEPANPVTSPVSDQDHSIHWRGFGEADYKGLDQRQPELGSDGFVPGSAANFYTGTFDLLLTSAISNRARVLSEINFEENDAQEFDIDIERLLLTYDFKDWLQASFGRYQTAIGYYNTTFMRASWPQTMADRPLIMSFPDDGGILPVQAIGMSLRGAIPSGPLGLNYVFEYGSSDTIRHELNGSGRIDDENNGNQVNVGMFMRPLKLPGWEFGGSFYHDMISDDRNQSIRYGQTILNAHVVYTAGGIEFLNEGILVRDAQQLGANEFNMPGFYTQFSKQVRHLRPFFRYQYVNTNPRSPLHDVLLRYGPSFGARYDFNPNIAFKLQFDREARKALSDLDGAHAQLAFTF